jgi:replicative DNA helicase
MTGNRVSVLDWEHSVIATVIMEPSSMEEAADLLPADFTGANQIAWSEILTLYTHAGIDRRSLLNALTHSPDWERMSAGVRVEDYLAEVLTFRGTNMRSYVDMVIDLSIKRTLRRHAALIAAEAEGNTKTAQELLDFAEQKIFSLRRNRTDNELTMQDLVAIFIPRLEGQLAGTTQPGWSPMLQATKDVIHYLEDEDFMTVAARPGEGKSSYMRFEFFYTAIAGKSVGILNYENSPIEYLRYFIGIDTGIDTFKLKNPTLLSVSELDMVRASIETCSRLRIKIVTTPRSISYALRAARKMVALDHIELLGLDYIQLLNNGIDNRANDIGLTTGGLRQFALDYHIPVIANAQLSRDIERRGRDENGNVEPELSDLRESGTIEQDSTIVVFPRPQRNPTAQVMAIFPENLDAEGRLLDRPRVIPTTFYVKKNRNGSTGPSDPVAWSKHNGRYQTLERGVLPR